MALVVYSTLSRKKEVFRPLEDGKVRMYVCGPTVYDHCHLGHARSYVSFDVIRRYLRYRGYDVKYVSNFTDVDDKIINRARETGRDPLELAEEFIQSFREDMEALGVEPADVHPRVTETIGDIIEVVQGLIDRGFAYESGGNVYFHVPSAEEKVGVLSHQTIESLMPGARIEVDEHKRHPLDFVLWKAAKEGEISWDSPWGPGRPGWHIECSVMSMKHLGEQIDVHGGGLDLVFPHHESEILQSECYTGKVPFARYWLHNGFLTVNREKMSKSLGNFFTIKEVLEHFPPKVVRFFIVNTHYRNNIDFSDAHLREAGNALERLQKTVDALMAAMRSPGGRDMGLREAVGEARDAFIKAMDDDFNTREALAGIFRLTRKVNDAMTQGNPSASEIEDVLGFLREVDSVFGILEFEDVLADEEIERMVAEREEARKRRDYATADRIRDELRERGIILEDTRHGVRWRRA